MTKTQTIEVNISLEFKNYQEVDEIMSTGKGICIASDTPQLRTASKAIIIETSNFSNTFEMIKAKYPDFYVSFRRIEEDALLGKIYTYLNSHYHHLLIK